MDTTRKAIRTLQIAIALVATLSLGGTLPRAAGIAIPGREGIVLVTPGDAREALLDWAIKRYRAAGLLLPPVRVAFHADSTGCRGNVGYQVNGLIDLCVRLALESGPERIVLHELAHAWCDEHLTDAARIRFMASRRLSSWNGSTADWKQRGYEQAAEIIAWGLGEKTIHPLIEGANDPDALTAGFRMLTSVDPLT
jgi:hypothetical protein